MKVRVLTLTGDYKRDVPRMNAFASDVQGILSGKDYATRDQMTGMVVDLVIDTAVTQDVKLPSRPLSVELLSAVETGDNSGVTISGGSVTWEWRGGNLRLRSFSALAAATRYNATILVRR